jgi:hypothetical protein
MDRDADLPAVLQALDPKARDDLRTVLIRDAEAGGPGGQPEREACPSFTSEPERLGPPH